ncbi:hypothetical protein Tco_1041553, partial [Tanacetum coccineum]
EEEPEPAKKVVPTKKTATKRQSSGVQIRDTTGVSVSKKKPPAKWSSEGADSELRVPSEPKGKSVNTSEGTGLKPGVPDMSKADSSESKTESDDEQTRTDNPKTSDDEEEIQDDKFVHTPEDYVPTDDELNDVTEEEYERINEELYGDVNVSLTDAEPADKEKDDVEMTVAGHVNVNQEGACNQVKDDAQATQKTDAPIPSSSISSDYAAKFLNFDNIPPTDTKVVSMMDINVQHEVPRTSSLLTIPMSVIPEEDVIKQSETTIQSVKEYLGSSLDDAIHKVIQKNVADIIKEYFVPAETVERLRQQYAPQKSVEDIREIKMEHARKQQVPKETITSSDTATLSILEDEDAMDEGVAEKLKKRKLDDADEDEGPSVRSDQGLKRQKTSKDS